MTQLVPRLVSALALCLVVSACAYHAPDAPSAALTMPTQCLVPAVDMTPPVPYEVLETRCGAEAWCAAWEFPQNHSMVYAQTFRQCVGRGMVARGPAVIVQPVPAAPAVQRAVPAPLPANPPRPYRN